MAALRIKSKLFECKVCGGKFHPFRKSNTTCSVACRAALQEGRGASLQVPQSFATSFWSRVRKQAPEQCWPWSGARVVRYGVVVVPGGKMQKAHRVAWALATGRVIPAGQVIRHDPIKCNDPLCCNPKHLLIGTVAKNNADKVLAGTSAPERLGPEQIREIRKRYRTNKDAGPLADEFGISMATVYRIVTRQVHKEVA